MDMNQLLLPVPSHAKFIDPDYYIWGASMVEDDQGQYHLFYSRWPKAYGHNAWLTHSEIAHAVADSPTGPYKHLDVALPARGQEYWDGLDTHNPTVHKFGDKYYLYYMGNTGDGKISKGFNWSHRNNQRIGVAVANHPNGPWKRSDKPLIDISSNKDAHDALMVSNPSIAQRADGKFVLVYKAVGKQKALPGGGPVVHLVALSDNPDKDFVKQANPVFTKPGEAFPAEDPYIWSQDSQLWAIVKDMHGAFSEVGQSLVLFESTDGLDWHVATNPLVSKLQINWRATGIHKVAHLERPQLWLKDGVPKVLFAAADENREHSFNVHIPLAAKK
ncbi:glycoside hydrolase family protein [Paraglaciecola sp. L3A3]|uniref:glycoside hydrolase family protein n=1 Tax=Paraglaciecola sp. L3A3 TaxID=2686358 RepID=UPI00131D790E|nr:glycoside hydrolase family protein [Paraglaciecola sp. L3A3]